MSRSTKVLILLLVAFVCTAYSASCGGGKGTLSGSDCLCESAYAWDSSTCTAETTTCTIPAVDDLESPNAITLGAGVGSDSFELSVTVPFEATRTVTSIAFDTSATSSYDFPTAFADYVRTAIDTPSCSDRFTISIPNANIPATITVTSTSTSVEYSGSVYVTTVETLSNGQLRTISQVLPFDYTFPIVSSSIGQMYVVSPIGTVLKKNILQQATTGKVIEVQLQLSSPFPYQLDWVDKAPYTGTKFTGTDASVSPAISPAPTFTVTAASACGSTAQGDMCVQTATLKIDYTGGCTIDGSYTLNFAVTGCNDAGGATPGIDCLKDKNGNIEKIPVVVTINRLTMGDLCEVQKVFYATAAPLVVYADSAYTITKSKFIASDANQPNMYIGCDLTIGPDATSIAAFDSFKITSVARSCAGVSTCTGSYVNFATADITDDSSTSTAIRFHVPVAKFAELTSAQPDIAYSIKLTASLLFKDNTKREVSAIIPVAGKRADTTPAGSNKLSKVSTANVQFASNQNQQTTEPTQAPVQNNQEAHDSGASRSVAGLVAIALIFAAALL